MLFSNNIVTLRSFSVCPFCDTGQKERCESTLLLHLGIAKHQYPYNSEAHTRKGASIRILLLLGTFEVGDFRCTY